MKASRFILFAILASLITFSSYASPDDNPTTAQWTYMGTVRCVSSIRIVSDGKCVLEESTIAMLYSNFDGENMVYKLYVPSDGRAYSAHRVGSGGAHVEYDQSGDYVVHVPNLSDMYTHCAGRYYFNPTDASK